MYRRYLPDPRVKAQDLVEATIYADMNSIGIGQITDKTGLLLTF